VAKALAARADFTAMPVSASGIGGELRLGEILVREGIVTEHQLAAALRWKKENGGFTPLGMVLVQQKVLTRQRLDQVLDRHGKRIRLGDALLGSGAITREQLDAAVAHQKTTRERLGQVLVKLGYLTEESLRRAISVQLDIPLLDLDRMSIDRALSRTISKNYARRHCLVPIASLGETLTVCLDDPTDRTVVEDVGRTTRKLVTVVTAPREAILRAQARLYDERGEETIPSQTLELITESETGGSKSKYTEDYQRTKTADTIVRRLLGSAIEHRASDVHIESLSNRLEIRFRIDGVLQQRDLGELQESCNQGSREILSRLKILAKLDIAERRRPQDGSFRVKIERHGQHDEVDLRLSIVPGYYGESAVLRILDRKNAPQSIDQLQFPAPVAVKLRQLLDRPSGIILVTGPTGSGKSTTLYASLMTVYTPRIRVLTAEDPIEYVYDQFSQSEVNVDIGNTFANYLRAFLRHDPEVIMVGEIRDQETAEMAFRAAQTGHLLLSTLHTNTAVGALPRLLDMKIDPNSLASSLNGVLGQRLVRRVCPACSAKYRPSDELLREFFGGHTDMTLVKGAGCPACHMTGYRGRVGIVELWVPSEEDIMLISKRAPMTQLVASAQASTFSMAQNAMDLLQRGVTTLEELVRVMPYSSVVEFRGRQNESTVAMAS
jgi:type II secretory ATPase GspE/PulE/Tfp pilus assembly ATPase PilB-like protein